MLLSQCRSRNYIVAPHILTTIFYTRTYISKSIIIHDVPINQGVQQWQSYCLLGVKVRNNLINNVLWGNWRNNNKSDKKNILILKGKI
jgi:hypothetical protein